MGNYPFDDVLAGALADLCEYYNITTTFYEEPPPKAWWQFWK